MNGVLFASDSANQQLVTAAFDEIIICIITILIGVVKKVLTTLLGIKVKKNRIAFYNNLAKLKADKIICLFKLMKSVQI